VTIRCQREIVGAWWVDPDGKSARPQVLGGQVVDGSTAVVIPSLRYWGLLLLELGGQAKP